MTWIEQKPEPTDIPNGELASLLTSNKQSISSYMQTHFYWKESSGLSAGVPRLSDGSAGPGSARIFFGPASQASTPGAAGKLMLTSDTSRLYGFSSTQSVLLGARAAIAYSGASTSLTTVNAGTRWLVQSGSTTTSVPTAGKNFNIVFPTAYGAAPFVELSPITSNCTQVVASTLTGATPITSSAFSVAVTTSSGTVTGGFFWRSLGTVAL